MTLSSWMQGKHLASPEAAVRLVLQKTLAQISSLTGDKVFLELDQADRLEVHLTWRRLDREDKE